MPRTVVIQPVNSIIFVYGGGDVDVPADKLNSRKSLVAASDDCLIVCVHPEIDGPTELTIGRAIEVDPGRAPDYVGQLSTPQRRLIIDQVDDVVVHDQSVDSLTPTIRIWFSHPLWPERVLIGID